MTVEIMSRNTEGLEQIRKTANSFSSLVVSPVFTPGGHDYRMLVVTGDKQAIINVTFSAGRWSKALGMDDINLRTY